MPPVHYNVWSYSILARERHATRPPKWLNLCHSCARSPYHPYAKIDGLITFLHANTMPQIRQNGRTDQNMTTSMPPIRQNGWTNNILACDHYATHTSKWTDQSEHHYLHATRTPKRMELTDSCMRPPCHPYEKINGLIPLLYATAMPPIRQNGLANQNMTTSIPPHTPKWMDLYILARERHAPIRQDGRSKQNIAISMPPIRQNGRTCTILARDHIATHTPKGVNLYNSCTRPPCHPYEKWTDQ
jgi:hypothetical protein